MTRIRYTLKYITVDLQVVIDAMCEILVLVSPQLAGKKEVVAHKDVPKNRDCMTAKGVMDVYTRRPLHSTIGIFGNIHEIVNQQQKAGELTNVPHEIFHNTDRCFIYASCAEAAKCMRLVSTAH